MALDGPELFLCSWGDIQLFVSSMEWDAGESQVVHDLAAGDFHPLQPRGSRIRKATVQIIFDDFEGARETGIAAFRRFEVSTKERRIFTHPVDGSFFARVGEFKPQIDEHSVIRASCEFYPDAVVPPVSPAGAGTSSSGGEGSVTAAADNVGLSLSSLRLGFHPTIVRRIDFGKVVNVSIDAVFAVGPPSAAFSSNISGTIDGGAISSPPTKTSTAASDSGVLGFTNAYGEALAAAQTSGVAQTSGMAGAAAFAFAFAAAALDADVRQAVASWSDEDVPIRKIVIDATRLSESIATMIEVGGLEDDLQLWPAFRDAILLGDAIRGAVVAATSETPSVFVVRVQRPTALLALAARIYGGFDAQARARQIASLNDIRTQGWIDPGDYLMPTRPVSAASPLLEDLEAG